MKKIFFTLSFLATFWIIQAQPAGGIFDHDVSSTSLIKQGQVTYEGAAPSAGSWTAAFDEDWNCVGAKELLLNTGTMYLFSPPVYETEVGFEGIDCSGGVCETFKFILWDAATNKYYIYPNKDAILDIDYVDGDASNNIDAFESFGTNWNFTGDDFDLLGILPVELMYFRGKLHNDQAHLSWATASEVNSDRFEIEHTTDGHNFRSIDQLAAKGNTNQLSTYSFVHKRLTNGKNYYRLKQFDVDGSVAFSNIVVIEKGRVGMITFPNPAIDQIQVETEEPIKAINIFDINGRLVLSQQMNNEEFVQAIEVKSLIRGTYLMEVETDANVYTKKIIKE